MKLPRIRIGKALGTVVRAAKDNPELALIVVGLVAPKVAAKAGPILMGMTKKNAVG